MTIKTQTARLAAPVVNRVTRHKAYRASRKQMREEMIEEGYVILVKEHIAELTAKQAKEASKKVEEVQLGTAEILLAQIKETAS